MPLHAGFFPGLESITNPVRWTYECHCIDQGIGHGCSGFAFLATQIKILDLDSRELQSASAGGFAASKPFSVSGSDANIGVTKNVAQMVLFRNLESDVFWITSQSGTEFKIRSFDGTTFPASKNSRPALPGRIARRGVNEGEGELAGVSPAG